MLSSSSIPFLLLLHLAVLIKTVSAVEGGEGTYPLAHITGPQIIENSTHIPVCTIHYPHSHALDRSPITLDRLLHISTCGDRPISTVYRFREPDSAGNEKGNNDTHRQCQITWIR